MAIWTGQPKKRAAFSPCVRGSWKLSPNPKLDVFDNTLGLCLTFPNSDGFRPPRFSPTYPFSSSLMTTGCIFSIFANFIALAFTSDRRFEKNFARDFIALAPSPVTYLLPAFRKNTSVKHIHALAFTSDLSFARFSKKGFRCLCLRCLCLRALLGTLSARLVRVHMRNLQIYTACAVFVEASDALYVLLESRRDSRRAYGCRYFARHLLVDLLLACR